MPLLEYSDKLIHTNPSQKAQKCKVCPYFTTLVFFMVNHSNRHKPLSSLFNCEKTNLEIYHCNDCNFQTELTFLFKKHIQDHRNREPRSVEYVIRNYVCKKCNFKTHFSMKWLQHTTTCLKSKIKKPQSSKKSQNKPNYDLIKHMKTYTRDQQNVKWYGCTVCPFQTKHTACLKSHINARHLNGEDVTWFQCPQCPYKVKHKSNLTRHVKARHSKEQEKKWHECAKCAYKSKSQPDLKKHVNLYHSDETSAKWYKCEKCSFQTKHMSNFKIHIVSRHLD
ncbi:hypothetical protein Zmor_019178 [Zophobas morio]|uniref:Protein hunchback n=1 Tax=Zophobas morio TaxID=2755281 RepID=A0AA38I3W9_9CUCU|nr:hypothetical protein Zmor_019178 [Zophobas morio]